VNAAWTTCPFDHSQIVQLECRRSGIWGIKTLWERLLTYKG
jgi:hypothetical protein